MKEQGLTTLFPSVFIRYDMESYRILTAVP